MSTTSILRDLIDPALWPGDEVSDEATRDHMKAKALLDAALLVRRGGLEHLVLEVTRPEALAMVVAGELIAKERATILAGSLADPAEALAPYDNGAMKRKQVMAEARAAAGRGE